jgi:hypothetical protein
MPVDPSVALFSLFSLLLIGLPLWQAMGKRSVDGIISDQDGKPLPSAKVQLRNLRTADIRSCVTDDQGRFHFAGLSTMADYEIAVEQDERLSEPVRVWQYAYHSELHLQLESHPAKASHAGSPLMVVREGIDDPNWLGIW